MSYMSIIISVIFTLCDKNLVNLIEKIQDHIQCYLVPDKETKNKFKYRNIIQLLSVVNHKIISDQKVFERSILYLLFRYNLHCPGYTPSNINKVKPW